MWTSVGFPSTRACPNSTRAAEPLRRGIGCPPSSLAILSSYPDRRGPTSRLSAYLHFGFIGAHEILLTVVSGTSWDPEQLGSDAFFDQLVTWRELGFNACVYEPAYATYDAVPAWARASLAAHEADPRPHCYSLEELDEARTHDEIWNAAQRELRVEGRIHNYLRMLWGKKVLEWSPTPREAFDRLVHLNNRYAPRRTRPQLVQRHRVVLRTIRPCVGRATDLREGAVHEQREHSAGS